MDTTFTSAPRVPIRMPIESYLGWLFMKLPTRLVTAVLGLGAAGLHAGWTGNSAGLWIGVTIVLTYLAACFIQTTLHLWLGHHRRGGWFFDKHVHCHHQLYTTGRQATDDYLDEETSLTPYYVPWVIGAAALGWWLLPIYLFVVLAVTFAATFWLHVYLHVQCHVRRSWLNHFAWFRELRRFHAVHHRRHGYNLAVLEPLCDRVLGTYLGRDRRHQRKAGR